MLNFRRIDSFDSKKTGFAGTKSQNYCLAEFMWKISSAEDLVEIASDNSYQPAVRCYALQGILKDKKNCEKVADSLPELEDKLRSDYTECVSFEGCCGGTTTVSEICYELFQNSKNYYEITR